MTEQEKEILTLIRESNNPNALEIAIELALNLLKQS
jgi:hypothetical protein